MTFRTLTFAAVVAGALACNTAAQAQVGISVGVGRPGAGFGFSYNNFGQSYYYSPGYYGSSYYSPGYYGSYYSPGYSVVPGYSYYSYPGPVVRYGYGNPRGYYSPRGYYRGGHRGYRWGR